MQTDRSELAVAGLGGNNKLTYGWNYIRASMGTPADARLVPEIWGSI
jgi:hypothetical protein